MSLVLVACGQGGGAPPQTAVRDSAGIRIVDNGAALWQEADRWRLDPEPRLEIGVAEGDPAHQLFGARSAALLGDGRLVVANTGTRELRVFDPAGRFLRAIGREGDGPGEFRSIDGLWRYRGDSLAVADRGLGRVSVFTPDGGHARSARLETEGGRAAYVRGVFVDGSFLAELALPISAVRAGERFNTELEYLRLSPEGALIGSLGRFPRALVTSRAVEGVRATEPVLPGVFTHSAVAGPRLIVGTGEQSEVVVVDVLGGAETRIRWPDPVRPFTSEDKDRFAAWQLSFATTEEDRERRRALIEQSDFGPFFATHGRIRVDGAGHVWVERVREPWMDIPYDSWLVFDPEGRLLGPVEVPLGLEMMDIGADYLLGRWLDDLGVERLRLYGLRKPGIIDQHAGGEPGGNALRRR